MPGCAKKTYQILVNLTRQKALRRIAEYYGIKVEQKAKGQFKRSMKKAKSDAKETTNEEC